MKWELYLLRDRWKGISACGKKERKRVKKGGGGLWEEICGRKSVGEGGSGLLIYPRNYEAEAEVKVS